MYLINDYFKINEKNPGLHDKRSSSTLFILTTLENISNFLIYVIKFIPIYVFLHR